MIIIAAGSSLPFGGFDSQDIVLRAFRAIGRMSRLIQTSSLYESPAWPDPSDPPFVNAVAILETGMDAAELLACLHAIEAGFGRRRTVRNAPRTLDLDLLAFGDERREPRAGSEEEGGLTLPHPRIEVRAFVLKPLEEIAPDWRHPVSGETAAAMLARLDHGDVKKIR